VVAIVVMLAVTMVVAGWQQSEEQIPIEVEEDFDEKTLEYTPDLLEPTSFINVSSSAEASSQIDGEEALELNATVYHYDPRLIDEALIPGDITVNGNISSELDPEKLVIESEIVEAPEPDKLGHYWLPSQWESDGLDSDEDNMRSSDEQLISDVEKNNFSAGIRFYKIYFTDYFEEPTTIEFRAILQGLSEEVTTITRITLEPDME